MLETVLDDDRYQNNLPTIMFNVPPSGITISQEEGRGQSEGRREGGMI
jgi:hypothetical protein